MNKVVTFEHEDSRHKISIIQSVSGEERTTLGVKWTEYPQEGPGFGEGMIYRGFWVDTTDIDPLEATAEFASRLLTMLVDPDAHVLKDGITPVGSQVELKNDVGD